MNVLGIYYKHKPGGFCKRLYRAYEALADAGHKVHYISTEILPVRHKNIVPHVMRLPCQKTENLFFWFLFTLCAMFHTCYLSRKLNVSTVLVMGSYYGFVNGFNRMVNKTTLVTYIHARDTQYSRLIGRPLPLIWLQHLYENISFSLSDMIMTINSSIGEDLKIRYPQSRVEVLPNNIELPETTGSDFRKEINVGPDTVLVSTSGVFTKGKNVDLLIRAFSKAHLDDALLVIVGDISTRDFDERRKLEALVENLSISDKVIFSGWRKDAGNIIKSTNLFVLPSVSEGCPLALLEALGLGVPCVGSRIPEIKEVLYYDELLFDPLNEEELTQKLVSSTNKETLAVWHDLCEKRRAVYTFDWDKRLMDMLEKAGADV